MMIAPAGIVVDALPLKFKARLDFERIAASLSRSATLAAPTTSGAVPNALLKTRRTRSPAIDVCTISRSVWLLKLRTGAGPGGGPAITVAGVPGPAGTGPGAAAGGC